MIKIILNKFKNFADIIYHLPSHNFLLHNAIAGNITSQYNLAIFYFTEKKNYIEAYAWAEVAYQRFHPYAHEIKLDAEKKLKPEEFREAWKKARNYKMCQGY